MISRKHPVCNWVLLPPLEHRRALDRVLSFRDKAQDPHAAGLPAAAIDWFWQEELPRLMQRPEVQQFAQERVSELNAKAAELRQSIQRQVGSMQNQADAAQQEAARITRVLSAVLEATS